MTAIAIFTALLLLAVLVVYLKVLAVEERVERLELGRGNPVNQTRRFER